MGASHVIFLIFWFQIYCNHEKNNENFAKQNPLEIQEMIWLTSLFTLYKILFLFTKGIFLFFITYKNDF
ncbi:hypothetical protein A9498_31135 (plasmid) [Bacillus thuringiensis serovar coreanensis]|nr:hypothetical protein A9498_31135 [Bacillus thuringiensis serovar coreanensis]